MNLYRILCRFLVFIVGDDVRSLGNCIPTRWLLQGAPEPRASLCRPRLAVCQGFPPIKIQKSKFKNPSINPLILFVLLFTLCCFSVHGGEVIPPAPTKYFNDYAGAVSPATAAQLNQKLEDFERQTSSQILVAVYPKMQSDSSIEDYTVRVAQSWKVGQKAKDNGAVLFVFIQDRKMYIQVGYGLEGALPDALAKRIIENEIKPRFRNGDFNGGLIAGVNAMLAATRGEYKGTGSTVAESHRQVGIGPGALLALLVLGLFALVFISAIARSASTGAVYRRRGYSSWGGWTVGGGGWGSSGGWGGGGGGGFSGGGGSFGGGGAGGSW
jgi:uncharacterized protein